jgi:WD40 repeat protein
MEDREAKSADLDSRTLDPHSSTSLRDPRVPERIGRFTGLARLGEGGFGIVYRAYDPHLKREVALKVAKAGALLMPRDVERFIREARAAAQLRHPNIVPLYEAGRDGPHHFIASAFIKGQTLAAALELARPDLGRAVQIARQLAEALAYAHEQGIIHRDVKPGNIMLDERGQPLLMDFGLATSRQEAEKLTQEGMIVGTPLYMAPEQASSTGVVQPASDQYSLGVILYEILCGQTPFSGPPSVTIYHHLHVEPPPPRRLAPDLPRDLETICLKTLCKKPAERYRTCQELADDLRRWQHDEPISARRLGLGERLWRWCKKEPWLAATSLVAVLALVGVAVVMAVSARRQAVLTEEATNQALIAGEQRDRAEEEKRLREQQLRISEQLVYAGRLALAQSAWQEDKVSLAWAYLDSCNRDLRGWEHDYLNTLFQSNQRTFRGHSAAVNAVVFQWDGKRSSLLASGSKDGTVKVWSPDKGEELFTLAVRSEVLSVAFNPSGDRLASAAKKGTISIWDIARRKELLTLEGHMEPVQCVVFSHDGKRLASSSWDGSVIVWDADTGHEVHRFTRHKGAVHAVGFSPDGKRLASAGKGGEIKVWTAATGEEWTVLQGHLETVNSLAWSPDGSTLASAADDGTVRLWDPAGRRERVVIRRKERVMSVRFSPDSKWIVSAANDSAARDGTLQVHDASTGEPLLSLRGHLRPVRSAVFSPNGRQVASASEDGTVKVWALAPPQGPLILHAHARCPYCSAVVSSDGQHLVSAGSADDRIKVWDLRTGQLRRTLTSHPRLTSLALSPNNQFLAGGGDNDIVKVWSFANGRELCTLSGHQVVFHPDSRTLACAGKADEIVLCDVVSRQEIRTLNSGHGAVNAMVFNPAGDRLASGCQDGTLQLWDPGAGQQVWTVKGHTADVLALAFSPDGRRLATGSEDRTMKVWDAATGQELLTLAGHAEAVLVVAFTSDGRRLASGSTDQTISIWDADTGRELLTLRDQNDAVTSLGFSRDGTRLVSAGADGILKIHVVRPGLHGTQR